MLRLLILSIIFIGCSNHIDQFEISNPANDHGKFPRLFTDNTGTVYMSWYEQQSDVTQLFISTYKDEVWSEPSLISESNDWFVNWADFPSIIGYNGSPLAAHWLQKTPGGTYSYDVSIANASSNFSEPFTPHDDGTPTEHGFASMIPLSDSSFYAVWLDGRNTMGGGHGHDNSAEHKSDLSSAMTLRGAMIHTDGTIMEQEIDPSVCDCCNTSIVQTTKGLLVAYRNRTEDEFRDMYVSTFSFDTNEWSNPVNVYADNWQIAACPVNGPMLDAMGNDVVIAWFTGADNKPLVNLAFSSDAGSSFSTPIVIDNTIPLGRVDVILTTEKSAWVSWMTRNEEAASLELAEVSKKDGIINTYSISNIDPSRSNGFPQLTKLNNGLMLAWTDISGESPKVVTKIIR